VAVHTARAPTRLQCVLGVPAIAVPRVMVVLILITPVVTPLTPSLLPHQRTNLSLFMTSHSSALTQVSTTTPHPSSQSRGGAELQQQSGAQAPRVMTSRRTFRCTADTDSEGEGEPRQSSSGGDGGGGPPDGPAAQELPPTQPVVLSPPPLPFPVFPMPATQPVMLSPPPLPSPVFPMPAAQPVQPFSQLLGMELPPDMPEEVMYQMLEVGALCWGTPSSHAME
jgi:hypothetical protein